MPRRIDIQRKTGTRSPLLLIAVLSVGLLSGGSRTPAVDYSSEVTSATPESDGVTYDNSEQGSLPAVASEKEEHGLSQKAEEIASLLGFPITNSMIVSWIVALFLIVFVQIATRNMKQVPEGAQNFMEWLVEGLYKFIEGILPTPTSI